MSVSHAPDSPSFDLSQPTKALLLTFCRRCSPTIQRCGSSRRETGRFAWRRRMSRKISSRSKFTISHSRLSTIAGQSITAAQWLCTQSLNTPEVIGFMDHNIGREVAWEGWGMPGQVVIDGPSVPGELNDVTVAQALDYVLQTFPGFWFYQNCHNPDGGRKISVGFIKN